MKALLASAAAAVALSFVPTAQASDLGAWLCIHSYEGSWTSNTGNGYYGGLQMDYGFMGSYGPPVLLGMRSTSYSRTLLFRRFGTANRWTPAQQIAVARYARDHGRGYWPWPKTARYCGLL